LAATGKFDQQFNYWLYTKYR